MGKTRKAPTEEELNPSPVMWPQCSDCGVSYVLRRVLSMSKGYIWAWSRDCKHDRRKSQPAPVLADADGPVDQDQWDK